MAIERDFEKKSLAGYLFIVYDASSTFACRPETYRVFAALFRSSVLPLKVERFVPFEYK